MYVNNEKGGAVFVREQTGDHQVIFEDEGGRSHKLPSHEFFAAHREADKKELAAYAKATPAPNVDAAAKRMEEAAKRNEKAAERAEAAAARSERAAERMEAAKPKAAPAPT